MATVSYKGKTYDWESNGNVKLHGNLVGYMQRDQLVMCNSGSTKEVGDPTSGQLWGPNGGKVTVPATLSQELPGLPQGVAAAIWWHASAS